MQLFTPIAPNYKKQLIVKNQNVNDILKLVKRAIKESKASANLIAPNLRGTQKSKRCKTFLIL